MLSRLGLYRAPPDSAIGQAWSEISATKERSIYVGITPCFQDLVHQVDSIYRPRVVDI